MKSIGELMKEMGFNPDAPVETQKAFFKHLVKDADSKQQERQRKSETVTEEKPAQLEFDLDTDKKVS